MVIVDRLALISTILFATAALLVLISISRPKWVLSVNEGRVVSSLIKRQYEATDVPIIYWTLLFVDLKSETSLGLIEICIRSSINSKCFIPHHIRSVWIIVFALSIGAIALLTITVVLFLTSQYARTSTIEYGRLTGFLAMIFLCLSTVLFPMGFDSEILGGSSFQLPSDYQIGSSYIAFVGATCLTVVSAIITDKMCLPRFVT